MAIGTHDLDTITCPVIYDAVPPNEIKFRALNQSGDHTAGELMQIYEVGIFPPNGRVARTVLISKTFIFAEPRSVEAVRTHHKR